MANDSSKDKRRSTRVAFRYPRDARMPEDLLDFIELPAFTRRWGQLGLDDEQDLTALQLSIMANPTGAKPIKGTKAIRKMRFAPAKWRVGKSGAVRVLYVYFKEFGIVLLCLAYGKGEVANISDAVKKYLNKLVDEQERELRRLKSLRVIDSPANS